jgi:hypothetical protein
MRISHAGISSGRPTTRFAAPASNRREPQLGLRRGNPARMTPHPGARARVPLVAALRLAARSVNTAEADRPSHGAGHIASRLRRSDSVNWSQPHDSGSRRPRPRSAAPWRG